MSPLPRAVRLAALVAAAFSLTAAAHADQLRINPSPALLSAGAGEVQTVAVSPDGRLLAAGGSRGALPGFLTVWDLKTRRLLRTFHERLGVVSVAFSPDGKLLAAACDDETVRVR